MTVSVLFASGKAPRLHAPDWRAPSLFTSQLFVAREPLPFAPPPKKRAPGLAYTGACLRSLAVSRVAEDRVT